jgi:SAM-dependent methyltransferase
MSDIPTRRPNAPPAVNRYGDMCAEVYVLDKPPGADLGDVAYYTDALGQLDGPVLEAACGSGRLMIPLLEAGVDISGFDRSESMLAQHRAACDARGLAPDLKRTSFEEFSYDERFAAIVIAVGTFTLIDHFDAACAALRRFHAHLRPGGRLFLDVMRLAYLTETPADHLRSWTTPSGDILRIDSRRTVLDLMRQRRVSHDTYQRWRDGRLVEQELEVLALRCWGLRELELALRDAGFGEVSVCGDYRPGQPPRASDRQWCFQAVRT